MDDRARLQLAKMIKANNVEDQTQLIRDLKHSHILKQDINTLILLKAKYRNDPDQLLLESMNECNFLFTYYTDIYNKIKKDEIDLNILSNFIDVLRKIEDGEMDQHEGSFAVGTLLKKLYVDSALKKAEKLDKEHENDNEPVQYKEPLQISWKQFKATQETLGSTK
uniref:Uncharacterized protein n=1 Tax=viral metagenome TaxID=1070528 RepID=A0A6C0DT19_9ZZZZ